MNFLSWLEQSMDSVVGFLWGLPLVCLLVGGGLFFLIYSGLKPFRYLYHGVKLLAHQPNKIEPGQLSHFQALSTALSGTLGMGNVSGVAIAIVVGGPGAIFWMWISAIVGSATKFYTCSLAVMYRGKDSKGELQGGPMYVIREGLGKKWKPLAYFFALAGLFGTMPLFQANQVVEVLRDTLAIPAGWTSADAHFGFDLLIGCSLASVVFLVAKGRLQRLAKITCLLVPGIVIGYLLLTAYVLATNITAIPAAFGLIFGNAFSVNAVAGGTLGTVIITGIQRAAYSNEAGIGTEAMAHGAAQTNEPIREGLVAMLGPVIDTLIICTCTALLILISDVWQTTNLDGISLTLEAFRQLFPFGGKFVLAIVATLLGVSTIFTFWYYGSKCLGFLIGAEYQHHYAWIYPIVIAGGAVASKSLALNIVDSMMALMAIPTMTSALLLAPKVNQAAKKYFARPSVIVDSAGA